MDATMKDVSYPKSSVRPGSDVIHYDDQNLASSDNWTTSPKHRKHRAEIVDTEVPFSDSDQEYVLGRVPEAIGETTDRKQAAKQASRFAHSPAASTSAISDAEALDDITLQVESTEYLRPRYSSQGLFVSEDEETLVTKGTTELNRPENILRKLPGMNGLKRARAIKADIKDNIAVLQSPKKATSGRRHVEDDPENQLIKTLRQEQNMSWNNIANYLNQERRNRGEAANFTDAAVYSRFVRNAPKIATAVGEMGFDPRDYMHLRHPNQYTPAEGTGMLSKVGKKRIKNYDNAKELEANMRKQVKEDEHMELETAEKTEQLMQAVAKVERNFWVLVADEMERATTKLYPPNVLASRYHAI